MRKMAERVAEIALGRSGLRPLGANDREGARVIDCPSERASRVDPATVVGA